MSLDNRNLDNESLAPTVERVVWSLAAVAFLVCGLRFYTRIFLIRRMGWDDWLMLFSMVLMIKNSIFVQISIHYGLGKHMQSLSLENQTMALKWDYLAQPSSIMAPTFGRISFALLLLSVAGPNRFYRLFLWGIIITQFIANSLCFIFILIQCKPIELLWDKSLNGTCWDLKFQEYFGYFDGSLNSATDLALATAPAFVVWRLNMQTSVKITLTVLMGLGLFAMIGSIVKTISLSAVGSHNDYTYNTSYLVIWYSVENYLVIIAASVSTLKPLISRAKRSTEPPLREPYHKSSYIMRRERIPSGIRDPELDGLPLTTIGFSCHSLDGETGLQGRPCDNDARGVMGISKRVDVSVKYSLGH